MRSTVNREDGGSSPPGAASEVRLMAKPAVSKTATGGSNPSPRARSNYEKRRLASFIYRNTIHRCSYVGMSIVLDSSEQCSLVGKTSAFGVEVDGSNPSTALHYGIITLQWINLNIMSICESTNLRDIEDVGNLL